MLASALCTWSCDRSATCAAAAERRAVALLARRPVAPRLVAAPDDVLRAALVRPEDDLRADVPFAAPELRADADRPDAAPALRDDADRPDEDDVDDRDVDRFAVEPLPDVLRLAVVLRLPDPPEEDDLGWGMGLLPRCEVLV